MTQTPDSQNPFLNSHDVSMRLFDLYLDRNGVIALGVAEVVMTDIPIRDVPHEALAAIDAKAKQVGLSRTVAALRAWTA